MILTVVESPLAGDFARNQRYARLCCIDCLRRGESPYASHLFFTQMLDDRNVADRNLGIEAGFAWAQNADVFAFYLDRGESSGMKRARERWFRMLRFGARIENRMLPRDLLLLLDSDAVLTATPGAI